MSRSSLRRFAVSATAIAIVCFCSCERHYPSELAEPSEHVKSEAAAKEAPHDKAKADEHRTMGDQQQMSTTALTPTPAATAPQFFPENSPH